MFEAMLADLFSGEEERGNLNDKLSELRGMLEKGKETKNPEHIYVDAKLAGKRKQIEHLEKCIMAFFMEQEKNADALSATKKEIEELREEVQHKTHEIHELERKMDDSRRNLQRQSEVINQQQAELSILRQLTDGIQAVVTELPQDGTHPHKPDYEQMTQKINDLLKEAASAKQFVIPC